MIQATPGFEHPVYSGLPMLVGEVVWMLREEMARTVEDVLARRSRLLFIDAAAAGKLAPGVAQIMASELGRDTNWIEKQLRSFGLLVQQYLLRSEEKKDESVPVEPGN